MYFYLSKFLQELLWPLNWTFAGLAAAFFLVGRQRWRAARNVMALSFVGLYVFSTPLVSNALLLALENAYPSRPVADYPQAGAIVVLGGSVSPAIPPRFEPEEVSGSRLLPAARLYKAGKAPLIVTAGGYHYQSRPGVERFDAQDMKQILVDMGVPPDAVLTEGQSRTTREDAHFTMKLLKERGIKSILLVTSAFHLRRAAGWFRGEGVQVVPVPVGREVADYPFSLQALWPTAAALSSSTKAIKEYVGHLVNQGR